MWQKCLITIASQIVFWRSLSAHGYHMLTTPFISRFFYPPLYKGDLSFDFIKIKPWRRESWNTKSSPRTDQELSSSVKLLETWRSYPIFESELVAVLTECTGKMWLDGFRYYSWTNPEKNIYEESKLWIYVRLSTLYLFIEYSLSWQWCCLENVWV